MKRLSIALAALGLLIGTVLLGWFGFGRVVDAVLSVGWGGFGLLIAWQLLLFAVLAAAWSIIAGRSDIALGVFFWGRMVRDSATTCLPFSPVGGFVLGARAITLLGVSWPLATASLVVDVTAEVLAQMVFALIGLCILIAHDPFTPLAQPIAIGIGVAVAAMAAFIWAQQGAGAIFDKLGRRIAGHWFDDAQERVAVLQDEIGLIYGRTSRLAVGAFLHLLGWIGTAIGTWIGFNLLGVDIDLDDAIAIEALLHAVLAVAFLVPGYAGVQEAAYAGLGMLFGVPPDIALGMSLLRRAKDLAIGIPVLLVWQFLEVRRLRVVSSGE
ncbi:MAG TPA: lysylphosphatidylglycerol synthase domain-containing protein [Acetobacteraceae bacterium]|nr:lysylphosphatidylglycerol synthase domain-containing protein [Acetobacteraceae bacterium]